MKITKIICPNCGAGLKADERKSVIVCDYCGTTFSVEKNDIFGSEDATENAGYHFEKGRQRAVREEKSNNIKKYGVGIAIVALILIFCTGISFNILSPRQTTDIDSEETMLVNYEEEEFTDSVEEQSSSKSASELSENTDDEIVMDDTYVINCLKNIDTISEIEAVTEDHDPNGLYQKQGGYIECIYFSDTRIDKASLYLEDSSAGPVDVGCDGGGAIEIFRTADDAASRDTYLGGFDGTALSSGSHHVYGTVIIRTSTNLTASQQNELTEEIVDVLGL